MPMLPAARGTRNLRGQIEFNPNRAPKDIRRPEGDYLRKEFALVVSIRSPQSLADFMNLQ